MPGETDKYLISSVRQGDYKTFEIIFRDHYSWLCRYARGLVNTPETAEDIVSDVFVRLWESAENLIIHTSLKAYLLTSVHNACINHIRRDRMRWKDLDDETVEKLNAMLPPLHPDAAISSLMAGELEDEMKKAVDDLPPVCGDIFRMSRNMSLTYKQIADRLQISENTVKVQIFRALTKLREVLKKNLE